MWINPKYLTNSGDYSESYRDKNQKTYKHRKIKTDLDPISVEVDSL